LADGAQQRMQRVAGAFRSRVDQFRRAGVDCQCVEQRAEAFV
jgi:hypothetical protein